MEKKPRNNVWENSLIKGYWILHGFEVKRDSLFKKTFKNANFPKKKKNFWFVWKNKELQKPIYNLIYRN